MIPGRRIYQLFFILMFLLPWKSIAQQEEVNFSSLLDKVQSFSKNMQPDSIIAIADNIIAYNDQYAGNPKYQDILTEAVLAAILNRQPEIKDKYIRLIASNRFITGDPARYGQFNHKIASYLLNMHQYEESMKYCRVAYESFLESDDKAGQAGILTIMYDNAYYSQADSSNTEYLDQAIEIAEYNGDSTLLSDTYFTAGRAYYRAGDLRTAIAYYERARRFTPSNNINSYLGICIYQHIAYTICDSVTNA